MTTALERSNTPWRNDPKYGGMSDESAQPSWEAAQARQAARAAMKIPEHDPAFADDFVDIGDPPEWLDEAPPVAPQRVAVNPSAWQWREPQTIPPRRWLYGRHHVRRFVTATIAPGGMGKSSLALVEAVAMASGRALLDVEVPVPLRVWYWNGEDPREELDRRLASICAHYEIQSTDIDGRLFIDSGRDVGLMLAQRRGETFLLNEPLIAGMIEAIRARSIDLLVLDPFVSVHAVPENDNGAVGHVAKALAGIAEATNAGVEVVHHTRKPGAGGGDMTADDARGASALLAAVRSARVLNSMGAEDATRFDVAADERWRYFRVDDGKANLRPAAKAVWRRLVSVPLGNGTQDAPEDLVGVATAWAPPDAFDGIEARDLLAVQQRITAGAWRESAQSPDWVGRAVAEVLDLDLSFAPLQNRVKSLVKAWLASGALKVVERDDEKRRTRKFVEVGQWAT